MELPSRPKNDRYTRPGQYNELEKRLRANPATEDIPALVCYAFDCRTRLGPFLFADMRLLTAGPRAVAAALHDAGFTKTRIVLRQWNRNFKVSEARLDGAVAADAAGLQHADPQRQRLRDDRRRLQARRRPAAHPGRRRQGDLRAVGLLRLRPGQAQYSADVVCTGEEFVLLELLDRLMEYRAGDEHLRKTFHRLRRSGLLDDIPGLVFREGDEKAPLGRLINTGIQRHGAGPRRVAAPDDEPGPDRAAAPPPHSVAPSRCPSTSCTATPA